MAASTEVYRQTCFCSRNWEFYNQTCRLGRENDSGGWLEPLEPQSPPPMRHFLNKATLILQGHITISWGGVILIQPTTVVYFQSYILNAPFQDLLFFFRKKTSAAFLNITYLVDFWLEYCNGRHCSEIWRVETPLLLDSWGR